MTSPPRTLRRSPPRRALHERSEAQTNEVSLPSLRTTSDTKAQIHRSSPFPTQASQVLLPNGRGAGWVFEDEDDVSDNDDPGKEFAPAPLRITKDNLGQDGASGRRSGVGAPASHRHLPDDPDSVENMAPSSLYAQYDPMAWNPHEPARPVSDEMIELPSLTRIGSREGRADTSHSDSSVLGFQDAPSQGFLPSKISENSLSSTESSATVIRKTRDRSSHTLYSAFPPTSSSRPSSSTSYQAPWTPPKPIISSPVELHSPALSASVTPEDRRIPSTASHSSLQEAVDSGANVQYPVLRPPAFSGSRAESSENGPKRSVGLGSRGSLQKWNPHLSTVQSEHSDDRSSAGLYMQASVLPGNRSSMLAGEPSDSANRPLPPVPAWGSQRDGSTMTIRVVGNEDMNSPDQSVPVLRSSGSAFFSILSRDSKRENRRDASPTRPATRGSFLGIPAWARYVESTDCKLQEVL